MFYLGIYGLQAGSLMRIEVSFLADLEMNYILTIKENFKES